MNAYSGYENWATWNICLWLSNDEGLCSEAKRLRRFNSMTEKDWDFVVGEKEAEKIVRELMPEGPPDFEGAGEFRDVNWQEVADCINGL